MSNQEKNELLAKWAGFTQGLHELTGVSVVKEPGGGILFGGCLPDFLHSLDAQAKWVLPEVRRKYGVAVLYRLLRDWVHAAYLADIIPSAEACTEAALSLIGGITAKEMCEEHAARLPKSECPVCNPAGEEPDIGGSK